MRKNISKIKITKALRIAIISILAMLFLSNCAQAETNTPQGCLKDKGHYYDPKTKLCVQVNSQLQSLILNNYRYLNRLVEIGAYNDDDGHVYKLEEGKFVIYFKNYLKISEVNPYWDELRAKGAKMDQIVAALPYKRRYDDSDTPDFNRYKGQTKTWKHGEAASCSWKDFTWKNPSDKSFIDIVEVGITEDEAFQNKKLPELRKAIYQDDDCRLEYMIVKASPQVMLDFWNNHLAENDQFLAIQPKVEWPDGTAPDLGPRRDLIE